ncbi:hypothetical protein VE00_10705 [Pseudogymnoascus sp. WSF 3629]|nr:hypothetical protein VE00_10705 [Pseudogymnoascus sp. WSF 3629]
MENNAKEKEPKIGNSTTDTYDLEEYRQCQQKINEEGVEKTVQELKDKGIFQAQCSEFITWAVKDLNANKDNPEAVKYHKLLCAKLEEIGNDLVAMAASQE